MACAAVSKLKPADLRPLKLRDFRAACQAQKASVHAAEIERYVKYDAQHGARHAAAVASAGHGDDDDNW